MPVRGTMTLLNVTVLLAPRPRKPTLAPPEHATQLDMLAEPLRVAASASYLCEGSGRTCPAALTFNSRTPWLGTSALNLCGEFPRSLWFHRSRTSSAVAKPRVFHGTMTGEANAFMLSRAT